MALFPSLSWQDPALKAELHTEGDAHGADGEDVDKHEVMQLQLPQHIEIASVGMAGIVGIVDLRQSDVSWA